MLSRAKRPDTCMAFSPTASAYQPARIISTTAATGKASKAMRPPRDCFAAAGSGSASVVIAVPRAQGLAHAMGDV